MIQGSFITGDEWLYYKIYCGAKTSDIVLLETIKPLMDKLVLEKKIDKWFFIRYQDPEYHIRLRLHFPDLAHIGIVINEIRDVLSSYVADYSVHKIQLDTYQRELERYGEKSILEVEQLFYNDSACISNAMEHIKEEELFLLFTLKSIDGLLQNFGFDIKDKRVFVKQQMDFYKLEFEVNKAVNKQLNKKFRDRKDAIFNFLNSNYDQEDYKPIKKIIAQKNILDKPITKTIKRLKVENKLSVSFDSLLGSLVHMSVNRTFRSKQRMYEMMLYDFLERTYRRQIGNLQMP